MLILQPQYFRIEHHIHNYTGDSDGFHGGGWDGVANGSLAQGGLKRSKIIGGGISLFPINQAPGRGISCPPTPLTQEPGRETGHEQRLTSHVSQLVLPATWRGIKRVAHLDLGR